MFITTIISLTAHVNKYQSTDWLITSWPASTMHVVFIFLPRTFHRWVTITEYRANLRPDLIAIPELIFLSKNFAFTSLFLRVIFWILLSTLPRFPHLLWFISGGLNVTEPINFSTKDHRTRMNAFVFFRNKRRKAAWWDKNTPCCYLQERCKEGFPMKRKRSSTISRLVKKNECNLKDENRSWRHIQNHTHSQ